MSLAPLGRRFSMSTPVLESAAVASAVVSASPASLVLDQLEQHRRELTGYCYRMLGSGFEADDAVQETMVRAWRSAERFEGRASVRSWPYRLATHIFLDLFL